MTKTEKADKCDKLLGELVNAHDSFMVQISKEIQDSTIVASMSISHVDRLIKYRKEDLPNSNTLTNKVKKNFDVLIENRNKMLDRIVDKDELKKRVRIYLLGPQKEGNKDGDSNTRKHAKKYRHTETSETEKEGNIKD